MCFLKIPSKASFFLCLFLVMSIAGLAQPDPYRMPHLVTGPWNFNAFAPANGNFNYIVTLSDGSEMNVKSKIHVDTSNKKQYLLLVDKKLPKSDSNRTRKIYCYETRSITREDKANDDEETIIAFATDSCWLFREERGFITLYAGLPKGDIVAFRLDNGPVEAFSRERLKEILKGDEKALKKLERGNHIGAVREYNSKQH